MEPDYDVGPTPAPRPATPSGPESAPAELQALAGNQAMVDAREQAGQLRKPLLDLKDQLLRDYWEREELLVKLEELEESKEITDRGKEAKAELTARQQVVLDNYAKAASDLELLDQPGAGDQQINELLARRGVQANVAQTRATNTLDASGLSMKVADKTTLTEGDTSTVNTKDRKFELGATGPAYSWGAGQTATDAAGNSTTTASSTSSKVDLSGWSKATENKTELGDFKAGNKETVGVKRGDGKLGFDGSFTQSRPGVESTTTVGTGVIAGPDGAGTYTSVGKSVTQEAKNGVKTGQSAGLDGKWVADVKQVEGSDPAQYQVSLIINLGAKLGANAGKEFEGDKPAVGSKADVSGSASLSASLTGTFVHVFSAEDTKKYLGALDANGSGGAGKEFAVIGLAAKGSIADAQKLLSGVKAAAFSPSGAAGMADGDSVELEVGGTADLKAGGGASAAGFGGKLDLGPSAGETLKRNVANKGGKVVITISVATTTGLSGGLGVSAEAASGSYSRGSTAKAGESVTFSLDPNSPKYAENFALIADRASIAELRLLASEHPDLVSASTSSSGEGSTEAVTAGVAGVAVGFNSSHSLDRSTTKDASGTTTSVTGSTGGGMTVEGLGAKAAYSEKETAALQVGPGNVGSGDISKATSQTDFGATWDKLKETWNKTPVGLVVGMATGGAKVAQEKTEVAGMKLSNDDFTILAAAATEPKEWARPVASPRHFAAWQETGRKVAAAGGDRQKIADALATYASEHDGATDAIRNIVRRPGSADGGQAYEWPNDTAAEKTAYESLVDGDPLAPIRALEDAGKNQAALESINSTLQKLNKLSKDLDAKKEQFSTSALGEMLGRLAERRRALATRSTLIQRRVAAAGTDAPAAEPSAEDTVASEWAGAKAAFEGMLPALRRFEADQTRQFQRIGAERSKRDHFAWTNPDAIVLAEAFNELKDHVYPLWDKAVDKALETAKQACIDPAEVKPRPAKGWCNLEYQREYGTFPFVRVRDGVDW